MEKENFLKKAFKDMKESAKIQHEVDKANLQAVKAESKLNFEENRGARTLKKAKEMAKKNFEEAKLSPTERVELIRGKQKEKLEEAKERKLKAEEKLQQLD